MPKQVGGKNDAGEGTCGATDVSTEKGSPQEVEVVEIVTHAVAKAQSKPKVEATPEQDGQTTMPGIDSPLPEEENAKKTWGEVMVFTSLQVPINKLEIGVEPIEQTPSDEKVEVWVPHEAVFGGGVQEARRFIKDAVERDKIPAGTYIIARKVAAIRCKVSTIRRVETFEDE